MNYTMMHGSTNIKFIMIVLKTVSTTILAKLEYSYLLKFEFSKIIV